MQKRSFTKKKTLSGGPKEFRKWAEWEEGDYIIGTYKSTYTDNYDKPAWVIGVEEAQFLKSSAARDLIGKDITLNSTGMLDKAMEQVKPGEIVQITYNGTSIIEKGKYKGKESHMVEVAVMEEEGKGSDGDEESDDDIEL